MNEIGTLVLVASWEDRCRDGALATIEAQKPQQVVMFFYEEFREWSKANRVAIRNACSDTGTKLREVKLAFGTPLETWRSIRSTLGRRIKSSAKTTVDISTMPRESIWAILFALDAAQADISYIYYRPEKYDPDWLSRDPGRPRLMYKQSGIAKLGAETNLVIVTGFDPERTEQLVLHYEPRYVFLGFQTGRQFENNLLNIARHKNLLGTSQEVFEFELNAYSDDCGEADILAKISPSLEERNTILTSLGPKTSAIALYRIWRSNPDISLSYAPSNQFNKTYSTGFNPDPITGQLGSLPV